MCTRDKFFFHEGKTLAKHVAEIIYALRTLSATDFPPRNRINPRVRHRRNFDSVLATRVRVNFTHGVCNVMNYVERTAF